MTYEESVLARHKTIGVGVCRVCGTGGKSLLPSHICPDCRAIEIEVMKARCP